MFSSARQGRFLLRAGCAASSAFFFEKSLCTDNRTGNEATSNLHGLSPSSICYIFRPNPNLEIAFDTRTRNPIYVLERLVPPSRKDNNTSLLKRPNNFYEEKSLPEEFRSRISHYRGSGFDRGHLAAAANYMHTSQKELNDTFNLVNCSPQNHSMNASIWAQLERWTLNVAEEQDRENNADTYVLSGPLWMPARKKGDRLFEYQYSGIGNPPSIVSVPTHFFKVVVACSRTGAKQVVRFACFVVPNIDFDKRDGSKRRPLEDFLVPWTSLEAVTGLHFFPSLVQQDLDWKERADLLTNEIAKKSQKKLLLTDGSSNNKRKKWRFKADKPLAHFCDSGKC